MVLDGDGATCNAGDFSLREASRENGIVERLDFDVKQGSGADSGERGILSRDRTLRRHCPRKGREIYTVREGKSAMAALSLSTFAVFGRQQLRTKRARMSRVTHKSAATAATLLGERAERRSMADTRSDPDVF